MHESPVQSAPVAVESTKKAPLDLGAFYSRLAHRYAETGVRDRAAISMAIITVVFQGYPGWGSGAVKAVVYDPAVLDAIAAGIVVAALLALWARTSRLAIAVFLAVASIGYIPDWRVLANHTYLALWTIPAAMLFKEWWKSDLYAFYLRMTLGIVMIAAFSQKMLAGTYIDGSYLAYLGAHGSTTERMFSFLCDGASGDPCVYYRFISIFILAWQFAVGVLLLLGLRSITFLVIEIGFLLGAGVYADEMNFQILNIALLCIVFRFGMPLWLAAISVFFLILDIFDLSSLIDLAVRYVA